MQLGLGILVFCFHLFLSGCKTSFSILQTSLNIWLFNKCLKNFKNSTVALNFYVFVYT